MPGRYLRSQAPRSLDDRGFADCYHCGNWQMYAAVVKHKTYAWIFCLVFGWVALAGPTAAQVPPLSPATNLDQAPTVLPALPPSCWMAPPTLPPQSPPVHFFMMQPAFLYEPIGLETVDGSVAADAPQAIDPDAELASRLQVSIGNDNPFFDFRSPDNPGGVGYYRLHAQYQMVDAATMSCIVGLQAVTPAGLEADGLARGPTVLRPNLAWWQDLGGGTGLHGYLCKDVVPGGAVLDRFEQGYRCGLAWASVLPDPIPDGVGTFHFFMEALARYQPDSFNGQRPPAWEVLPGLNWQMNDSCWMSGAVVLPVGPARADNTGLWQLTCWWKF